MATDTKRDETERWVTRDIIIAIVALAVLMLVANALLDEWDWQTALEPYFGAVSGMASWFWVALYMAAFAVGGVGTAWLLEMRRRAVIRDALRHDYDDLIARAGALKARLDKPARRRHSS